MQSLDRETILSTIIAWILSVVFLSPALCLVLFISEKCRLFSASVKNNQWHSFQNKIQFNAEKFFFPDLLKPTHKWWDHSMDLYAIF